MPRKPAFVESEHPRTRSGRFTDKPTPTAPPPPNSESQLSSEEIEARSRRLRWATDDWEEWSGRYPEDIESQMYAIDELWAATQPDEIDARHALTNRMTSFCEGMSKNYVWEYLDQNPEPSQGGIRMFDDLAEHTKSLMMENASSAWNDKLTEDQILYAADQGKARLVDTFVKDCEEHLSGWTELSGLTGDYRKRKNKKLAKQIKAIAADRQNAWRRNQEQSRNWQSGVGDLDDDDHGMNAAWQQLSTARHIQGTMAEDHKALRQITALGGKIDEKAESFSVNQRPHIAAWASRNGLSVKRKVRKHDRDVFDAGDLMNVAYDKMLDRRDDAEELTYSENAPVDRAARYAAKKKIDRLLNDDRFTRERIKEMSTPVRLYPR